MGGFGWFYGGLTWVWEGLIGLDDVIRFFFSGWLYHGFDLMADLWSFRNM